MMVLMGCVATAAAYDYPYLTFSTQGGVTRSVAAEELVITFADGKMIAHSAQGDLELELQALDKMCFTTEQSGVSSAVAAGGVVRVFSMHLCVTGRGCEPVAAGHLHSETRWFNP